LFTDRYGLALSTRSTTAVAHYRVGVDLLLSLQPGAELEFAAALALDPCFAMAHAGLARWHQTWGRAGAARAAIDAATGLASAAASGDVPAISRRERQHIAVLASAIEGNATQALRLLLEHLNDFPRDALVLGVALGAFGLLAFSGRPDHDAVRLSLSERMASAYGDDWWFQGSLAWAHIEAGSLLMGERYLERSLALKPDNANAIHVFAHLAYEQNRANQSISRIDTLTADYPQQALLHNHLRWHCALGELGAQRPGAALAIYDQYLSPAVATAPLITAITDAVSLLWRIQIVTGQSAGEARWQALRDFIKARHYQLTVAFLDVHVAALYSVTGERDAFEILIEQLKSAHRAARLPAGLAVIELCNSLDAFAAGNARLAIDALEANLGNIVRIGGSGAQRDLFEETLMAAYAQIDDSPAVTRNQAWQKVRANGLIQA
jgi:tetratricopeptide (TPR) repeat protein